MEKKKTVLMSPKLKDANSPRLKELAHHKASIQHQRNIATPMRGGGALCKTEHTTPLLDTKSNSNAYHNFSLQGQIETLARAASKIRRSKSKKRNSSVTCDNPAVFIGKAPKIKSQREPLNTTRKKIEVRPQVGDFMVRNKINLDEAKSD